MPAAVMSWAAPAALGAIGLLQGNDQARRQRNAQQAFREDSQWLPDFLKNNGGLVNDQLTFAKELEPVFQRMIHQYLANNDPGRMDADINRAAGQNLGMAGQNALSSDAMLRSLGIGSGARGGNVAANYNQAAQQTNQYANYLRSPEGQSDRLQGNLSAIGQGQSIRALPAQMGAQQAWTDVYRALQSGQSGGGSSFGGMLGQLVGGAVQGGLFKGGGAKVGAPNSSLNQAFPTSQANGMQPAGQYGFGQQDMARALGQGRWAW